MSWFNEAARAGLEDYDVMGISYYSQWSSVPLAELSDRIEALVSSFAPRDLLVVETGYPWTLSGADGANNILGRDALESGYPATPAGQKMYLTDMTQAVFDGGGGGVVYWEPGWVSTRCRTLWAQGSHWENATFFNFREGNEVLPGIDFINHAYDFPEGRTGPVPSDPYICGARRVARFRGAFRELSESFQPGNDDRVCVAASGGGAACRV